MLKVLLTFIMRRAPYGHLEILSSHGIKFKIISMTAEDNRVAVEAESDGLHVSGLRYQNLYHFLFIFKEGKVLLLKEYMDTEKVTDVLCGGHRPSDGIS